MKLWLPIKKIRKYIFRKFRFTLVYTPTNSVPCLLGTLLVNERMLETYVIARDRFLVPKGKMFPTIGRL